MTFTKGKTMTRDEAINDLIACAETAVELANDPDIGAEEVCQYVAVALAGALQALTAAAV